MTRNDFPQCGDNQIEGGVALPASLSLSLSLLHSYRQGRSGVVKREGKGWGKRGR